MWIFPIHRRPIIASWSSLSGLTLWDPLQRQTLAFDMTITGLTASWPTLCIRWAPTHGTDCIEVGSKIVIAPKVVASMARHSTRICRGVAVQNVLGSVYFTLLEPDGVLHWPELDGVRIIDTL